MNAPAAPPASTNERLRALIDRWESTAAGADLDATAYLAPCREALDLGHPSLAYEVARHGLAVDDRHRELRYLAALALTRIASHDRAADLLSGLLPELAPGGPLFTETVSLMARIAKDRWWQAQRAGRASPEGAHAAELYGAAFRASADPFPGINAATLSLLIGQSEAARELARAVRARSEALLPARRDDPWLHATLGEAALLLDEPDAAADHYRRALACPGAGLGHLTSMHRQLLMIGSRIALPSTLTALFELPMVAVFTGHMIDGADRPTPRFPAALEPAVAGALTALLAARDIGFGYCSAASGGDLLFIEAMLARKAEVHVTLPCALGDFVARSVAPAGPSWIARVDAALARVSSVSYATRERHLGDDVLFEYAGTLLQGAAILRARQLDAAVTMVALHESGDPQRLGGTRATLAHWRGLGLPVEELRLEELRAAATLPATPTAVVAAPDAPPTDRAIGRAVRTMLFADMVGFSKLREEDTPGFFVSFLGVIDEVIRSHPVRPAFINTWGDGLFLVFDEVDQGVEFALRLRDAVAERDWPADGLPATTSIRIGMHTGPVFPAPDPILGKVNYFGAHVNRAARIEPVTAPGAVYVSEQTACLLAAQGSKRFSCDYLGTLPLAKGFGSSALYRVRRSELSE